VFVLTVFLCASCVTPDYSSSRATTYGVCVAFTFSKRVPVKFLTKTLGLFRLFLLTAITETISRVGISIYITLTKKYQHNQLNRVATCMRLYNTDVVHKQICLFKLLWTQNIKVKVTDRRISI